MGVPSLASLARISPNISAAVSSNGKEIKRLKNALYKAKLLVGLLLLFAP